MAARLGAVVALLLGVLGLGACTPGGDGNPVPPGDSWRAEVVEAIAGTPGVTSADITVHDVDSGLGHKGPLVKGVFSVTDDAVVDEALRRASDVLGEESAGVRISLSVRVGGAQGRLIEEFGYAGVGNGGSLWDATH